jgi:hypothetical protein
MRKIITVGVLAVGAMLALGCAATAGTSGLASEAPPAPMTEPTSKAPPASKPAPAPKPEPTTKAPPASKPAPAPKLEPTTKAPAAPACHPSYVGACLDPDASDYDCAGGSGNGPKYTGRVTVVGSDVFDLDHDGDGIGCDRS